MAEIFVKKGVDKCNIVMYTLIIPCDTELILENDTESRRTRTTIFTSRRCTKTVNSQ